MEIQKSQLNRSRNFLFRFPIELLINSQEGTYRKNIEVSERITKLTIKAGQIKEIIPDPDVNLLFRQVSE